jgi:hypothetical protein
MAVSVRERKGRITCLLLRHKVGLPGERNRGKKRAKAVRVTRDRIERQRCRRWEAVKLKKKRWGDGEDERERDGGREKDRFMQHVAIAGIRMFLFC